MRAVDIYLAGRHEDLSNCGAPPLHPLPKKLGPHLNTDLLAQLLGLVDLLESSAVGQEDVWYIVANWVTRASVVLICRSYIKLREE